MAEVTNTKYVIQKSEFEKRKWPVSEFASKVTYSRQKYWFHNFASHCIIVCLEDFFSYESLQCFSLFISNLVYISRKLFFFRKSFINIFLTRHLKEKDNISKNLVILRQQEITVRKSSSIYCKETFNSWLVNQKNTWYRVFQKHFLIAPIHYKNNSRHNSVLYWQLQGYSAESFS